MQRYLIWNPLHAKLLSLNMNVQASFSTMHSHLIALAPIHPKHYVISLCIGQVKVVLELTPIQFVSQRLYHLIAGLCCGRDAHNHIVLSRQQGSFKSSAKVRDIKVSVLPGSTKHMIWRPRTFPSK